MAIRSLSATLTANQVALGKQLVRIVLTKSGEDTQTFTTTRILSLGPHTEQPYSQTAEVLLDNSDGALTSLDLQGYKGVISYGYTDPSAGDAYSACAPLWIVPQQLLSYQGGLICSIGLAGIPNWLAEDRASAAYRPDSTSALTVKDLLFDIATKTGSMATIFSHCTAYTITFDSEDSLIDTFRPKDSFRIGLNGTRLEAIKTLLGYTGCVMRVEADEAIHIFVPTTSGASYDYEYKLAVSGEHTFFTKASRERVVVPGYITVASRDGDDPSYSGIYDGAQAIEVRDYKQFRLASDAQAVAIATAIYNQNAWDAEKGSGEVPMNCGAEVHDYVKITDSRQGDTRTGNIGYLTRHYQPGNPRQMTFSFGSIDYGGLVGTMQPQASQASAMEAAPSAPWLTEAGRPAWDLAYRMIWNLNNTIEWLISRLNYLEGSPVTIANVDFDWRIISADKVTDLELPTADSDATNKKYVDDALAYVTGALNSLITAPFLTIPVPYVPVSTATISPVAVGGAVDDDGGAQTDETTAANNAAANDMTLLPATPAVNDAYYFGLSSLWDWVLLNIGTQGAGVWTITWEYWNGAAWAALTLKYDEIDNFRAAIGNRRLHFTRPGDWAVTTVGGIADLYWMRGRVSAYTSVTTQPLGTQAWIGQY